MVTPADDCPLPIPLVSGAAGFFLLLASCNAPITGGQTGDGSGAIPEPEPFVDVTPVDADLGTLVADCEYEGRRVADDQATPLGFTANEVLAFAEGSFASELTWTPDAATGIGFRPERQAGLSIAVRRDSSAARLLEPADSDAGVNAACAPLLAIGVTIDFESEGGALRETFRTELRAGTRQAASFSTTIAATELAGALELDAAPADVSLDSIRIAGVLSPLGTAGSVQVVLDYDGTESAEDAPVDPLLGGTPAAYWPSETCAEAAAYAQPGIVVDEDVTVAGRSFTELARALEAFSPVELTWSDGRSSALRLDLVPTRACAVDQGGVLRLRGDVDVAFSTDDGALSGTLPGTLSDDGVPGQESWVSLNSSAFMPTDEFLGVVTLQGITVDGFDEVSFNLFLGGSESATGGLSITGAQECEGMPEAPDALAECFSPLFEAGLGELEPIDGSAAK